uniref:hypothetical protein n=2 Tax=Campylobacter avium TaxID=522485 RepID=UPI0023528086
MLWVRILHKGARFRLDVSSVNSPITINNEMTNNLVYIDNFEISGGSLSAKDVSFRALSGQSVINASKFTLQGSSNTADLNNLNLSDKNAQILISQGASVLVNGDLEFKDSSVIHIENDGSSSHSNFVVTGEVTGTGSIFAISATEYKALEFDRFIVLEAHGGISTTSDNANSATAFLKQDYREILSNSNINLGAFEAREQNLNNFVTYDVWAERPANGTGSSYGVMSGKLNENARDIDAVLNAKNTYLRSLYTQLEESRSTTDNAALKGNLGAAMQGIARQQAAITAYTNASTQAEKDAALKAYNALFIKDEQILELSTNLIDKNIANSGLKNYVIFEMLNSPSHKAATASAVNKSAKSIANSNSAISSQQQIINLANEAAI